MQDILIHHGENKFSLNPDQPSCWIQVNNLAIYIYRSIDSVFVDICPNGGYEASGALDSIYARFHDNPISSQPPYPAKDFETGGLFYVGETDFKLNPSETHCSVEINNLVVVLGADNDGLKVNILPASNPNPDKPISELYVTYGQADEEIEALSQSPR